MNLHRRPLFPIALGYVAGIVCAVECRLSIGSAAWLGVVIVLLSVVVPTARLPRSVLVVSAVMFLSGLIAASAGRIVPADDVSRYAEGKLVYLTGVIASDPEPRGDGSIRFILRTESAKTYAGEYPVSGRAMVSVFHPRWRSGGGVTSHVPFYSDRVRVHGRLSVPGPAANPHSGSYADFLARRRIHCAISAPDDEILRLGPGPGVVARAAAWSKAELAAVVGRLIPGERGDLLLGILLGNYGALSLSTQSAFMRTGTMHLLAASGYNCGVIVLIFRWLLQRLTLHRAWMHVFLILILWGFAVLTGAGPSIVRATIMVTVFLSAYLLWRAADMLNSVLLAGTVVLLANPFSLYDVGFQLSFAAVLAIVLAMPVMEEWIRAAMEQHGRGAEPPIGRGRRAARWVGRSLLSAVLLSFAATIGTAPIIAHYFNYLSLVSIPANAMVALLVVGLTVFGMLTIGLGSVPLLGTACVFGCETLVGWMLGIVRGLSTLPWASCSVRSSGWGFMVFYYVTVLMALEYAHRTMYSERKQHRAKIGETSDK